jgi:intracellular sulfur oxidation DsrE/DsrF family protein
VVTGTNGKSTTTVLIARILEAAGHRVFCGGNLAPGRPLSEALLLPAHDYYVVEASSFQLERASLFKPQVVVIHGTEIVTVAKQNEAKYQEAVDRMRYYADLGVAFKVCGEAAEDYGYALKDFQDFIEVVPNAITELAHWQQQGYALIVPRILDKRIDIESIRSGQMSSYSASA